MEELEYFLTHHFMDNNNTQLDPELQTFVKGIAMQEGGGKILPYTAPNGDEPNASQGTAGGRYQFTANTWKAYAGEVLNDPNAPMTPENQNQVAYTKMKQWKDSGKTYAQMASMWNAGEGSPDSWKPGTIQKTGDTPTYVKNVQKYAQQLSQNTTPQGNGYVQPPAPTTSPDTTNGNTDTTNAQPENLWQKAGDVAKGVGNFLFPIVGDVYNDVTGKSKKTFLQQAGDTALSALPFIPGLGEAGEGARAGEVALEGGADLAKSSGILGKLTGSTIAKGAGVGYGAGVASNLSQGKGLGESFLPNANTIGGAALGGLTPLALKGLGNIATKISGIDPQVYTELSNMGVEANPQDAKLYDQYINATKAHATNLRATSPLTMAANNLDTAAEKINTITDEAGKAVGEAKKAGATIPIAQTDVASVGKNFAQQVSDKYGLDLVSDEKGNVTATPTQGTMLQNTPADVSRIGNVATQLNKLYAQGDSATVKNASDIISNLNNLVDHTKDDMYGHTNDPLSGLLKSTAGNLNTAVRSGSQTLADANDRFSGLKDLQGELGTMAGKNLNKGELLMRRVFSGDKSSDVQDLFGKINQETGIDLTKHAVLAKHAIETVGSKGDKTLLEQAISGNISDKVGMIKGILTGTAKKLGANPERIGRNLVKGGSKGIVKGLITKGAIETGARLGNSVK
jgi:hypothetical protein